LQAPFLLKVSSLPEKLAPGFPFDLPFVRRLDLAFSGPVTFFVGENGSGKSTLLEAIAALAGLPVSGGSRNEVGAGHAPEGASPLATALRPSFRKRPRDGYFLRAKNHAHFASLLDARREDPDFEGDPYARYGGKSLHQQSHGESFIALVEARLQSGILLLDEPESALSPQRQLRLLAVMHDLVNGRTGRKDVQFIVATHSPILLTFPEAHIVDFDDPALPRIDLRDTRHYQITKGILDAPERYWKHLAREE
jgi:predicted ATPase